MIFNYDVSDLQSAIADVTDDLSDEVTARTNADTALQSSIGTYVRPNLLDNWYFAGGGSQAGAGKFPVNQRGQTTYSGTGYGIDRWKAHSATNVSIYSDYTTLTGNTGKSYYGQIANPATIAALSGKKLTITLLTYSGDLYTITGAGGTHFGLYTPFGQIYTYQTSNELFDFEINNGSSVNVVAVKAEIGEGQTLAHQENGVWVLNELPVYQEEISNCLGSDADSTDTYTGFDYGNFYQTEQTTWVPINSSYVGSGNIGYVKARISRQMYIVTVMMDIWLNGTYSSEGVAQFTATSALPIPYFNGGTILPIQGTASSVDANPFVSVDEGTLRPWFCGNVSGHWYGSFSYLSYME